MTILTRRAALTTAVAALAAPARAQAVYWPSATRWDIVAPLAAGFEPARLSVALETAKSRKSRSLLVLRGGRIASEWYAADGGPAHLQDVASVGKSLAAALTGMAIDDGRIRDLDQPAADFIPAWRDSPKRAITLRHLVTMTSGLDPAGLAVRNVSGDQFSLNSAAPLAKPPGSHWRYDTPAYHLLFHILARATGERFETYGQRRLLEPLGMAQSRWLSGAGQGVARPVTNYYSARCTARDLGRFGLFAQRGGQWSGRQLVSRDYFSRSVSPSQDLNPAYGYLWWNNRAPGVGPSGRDPGLRFPGSPPDTFAALGAGDQLVMISPSLDLVVVRQGDAPGVRTMAADLMAGVVAALRG